MNIHKDKIRNVQTDSRGYKINGVELGVLEGNGKKKSKRLPLKT